MKSFKISKPKPIDPKYIGVPNICFSLTNKEDHREKEFRKQRIKYGFDESETWSLVNTISEFIVPRLERYEEIAKETIKRDESLKKDINDFLIALKLIARDRGSWVFTDKENKQLTRGLKAFPDIFMSLTW